MRALLVFIVLLVAGPAGAEACKIKNFTYSGFGSTTLVQAEATCPRGKVVARFYNGETYLGNASGYIQGHAITLILTAPPPAKLTMKAAISPR